MISIEVLGGRDGGFKEFGQVALGGIIHVFKESKKIPGQLDPIDGLLPFIGDSLASLRWIGEVWTGDGNPSR